MKEKTVDFGRENVSQHEKTRRVHEVFDRVANRYDLMNDIMSFGTHRLLKRILLDTTGLRRGQHALDLAGGTGDVAKLLTDTVGTAGSVTVVDINESMVSLGRDRMIESGRAQVQFIVGNAEALPLVDDGFHSITIAFGLRNMTDKEQALEECYRVLKTNGKLAILEFSKPKSRRLQNAFNVFQRFWPIAGHFVVGDAVPYHYLVQSIDRHPSQEALAFLLDSIGFRDIKFENLFGGIVAIHQGTK